MLAAGRPAKIFPKTWRWTAADGRAIYERWEELKSPPGLGGQDAAAFDQARRRRYQRVNHSEVAPKPPRSIRPSAFTGCATVVAAGSRYEARRLPSSRRRFVMAIRDG